jgi:hypothetical protein
VLIQIITSTTRQGRFSERVAIEQLRQVAVEFEMAPLRHAVHILPGIMMAAREPDAPEPNVLFASLDQRLDVLADDLAWWSATLAAGR